MSNFTNYGILSNEEFIYTGFVSMYFKLVHLNELPSTINLYADFVAMPLPSDLNIGWVSYVDLTSGITLADYNSSSAMTNTTITNSKTDQGHLISNISINKSSLTISSNNETELKLTYTFNFSNEATYIASIKPTTLRYFMGFKGETI